MKCRATILLFCITVMVLCSSWGFFGHKRINRVAVFTLPKGMAAFYRANIDYITDHAVDPDKRRYVDSTEGFKHFFDADHYGKHPFEKMPQRWKEAERQYSADSLNKYGTVPWTIQYYYYRLVRNFKDKDTAAILKTSANLGHYIADAHVPLHLTENYNGQFTHQDGIHALWETRVPELLSDNYHYNVGKIRYINDPLKEAWKICHRTFKCVDSVLIFERRLDKTFSADTKYTITKRGSRNVKDYSAAYATAYSKSLHGMVERQMRASILAIGSFWFSAWVDAGQPNLDKLIDNNLQKKDITNELSLYKLGKVLPKPN
ncbi:S1/P1 Nuclease [Mucilaginibacter sp. HMF5004]|nr:S1/P1 Nuclease [Mucilaginibacter rivuli]